MRSAAIERALARYPTVEVSALALREGNRKRPVYTMHKWWARRSGAVFRMILLAELRRRRESDDHDIWSQFYRPTAVPDGFTVLDPFLGGGTTLIEAAKQGANCIGVDIDPVACLITELELLNVTPMRVRERFEEIRSQVEATLAPFYRTESDGTPLDVVHFFWVDQVRCPNCKAHTDAHPTFQLAYDSTRKRQTVVCPLCDSLAEKPLSIRWHECSSCGTHTDLKAPPVHLGRFRCPSCAKEYPLARLFATRMAAPRLFALETLADNGSRCFQRATDHDRAIYDRAAALLTRLRSKLPLPKAAIPSKGRSDHRPLIYGVRHYTELFNDRQLLGLGLIARAVMETEDRAVRRLLALAFSQSLASNNMLCGWALGYRRLTPLFGVHSYRKVTRPVEGNLLGLKAGRGSFGNAVRAVLRGCEYMAKPFEYRYRDTRPEQVPVSLPRVGEGRGASQVRVLNRSSVDLSPIETNSVDLVLTDPPYFDNLSYSELSDFYHVWLRTLLGADYVGNNQTHTPMGAALFGGKRLGSGRHAHRKALFTATLTKVFAECHRVLRPEGSLAFTFHHKSPDAWDCLGSALLTAGFAIDEVVPVRSEGRSGFHSYEGTIKWDSIFFCRPFVSGCEPPVNDRPCATISAVQRAASGARQWSTWIHLSDLEFSAADRASLAMSLVLREFSQCGYDVSVLRDALAGVQAVDQAEQAKAIQ
jgi:putative DNA methylase